MSKPLVCLSLLLAAACAASSGGVRARVEAVTSHEPHEVAVAYRSLDGRSAYLDADVVMHAASTMKVAVLIQVLLDTERGKLDLDARIPVENRFRSAYDGSEFSLERSSDGDPALHDRIGGTATVRELAWRMIARSSNLATNLLIEKVTPVAVQATIEALGTRHMRVVRGVEDARAHAAGIDNVTTARDLMVLMLAIADGSAFTTPAARMEAFDALGAQVDDAMIPQGLPRGTIVLHKTGEITAIRHDAAIVHPVGDRYTAPYVLVVLTRGYEDAGEAEEVVRRISRSVYAAHTGRGFDSGS